MLILLPQFLPLQIKQNTHYSSLTLEKKSSRESKYGKEKQVAQCTLGNFSKLPECLITYTASFLDFKGQIAFAKTCHNVNHLVKHCKVYPIIDLHMAWKLGVKEGSSINNHPLSPNLHWITFRSLIVDIDTSMRADTILDRCLRFPNATTLRIRGSSFCPIDFIFNQIIKANALKKITAIFIYLTPREFSHIVLQNFDATCLAHFPCLKQFDGIQDLSPANFAKVKSTLLPKLETIKMHTNKYHILEDCTSLKHLIFGLKFPLKDAHIRRLHETGILQNLNSIRIMNSSALTPAALKYLEECPVRIL